MKYFKLYENWNGESINEAKLLGSNSKDDFNPSKLQTFHRYVEGSSKQDPQKGMFIDFDTEEDANLYKPSLSGDKLESAGVKLKKGTSGINITIKSTNDLVQVPKTNKDGSLHANSPDYYVPIKYKNKEYLIALGKLRKPTGKAVEEWNPDLTAIKNVQGVTRPFKAGHPQEQQICEMFVKNTNADWEFEYQKQIFRVDLIGGANYTGNGHPKTDIELNLTCISDPTYKITNKNKIQTEVKDGKYKVSLKDKSANFVEGWIAPKRAVDIFGKDLQEQVQKIWDSIKNSDQTNLRGFKKNGTKGNAAALFIGVKDSGYYTWNGKKHSSSVDKWQLSPKSLVEAYAGEKKFGGMSQPDAIANCFYKGKTPKDPAEFLDNLIPVNPRSVRKFLEPLYIQPQPRNNPSSKSAILFRKDAKSGKWIINNEWLAQAGLAGKIK